MDANDLRRAMRARLPEAISDLRTRVAEHAPAASSVAREPLRIYNADGSDGDTAVLRIYDEIVDDFIVQLWGFGVSAQAVVAQLDEVTASKIRVEINSPGGDVFEGVAIYNALRAHPAEVTTRVDGIAASIASIIVQAGDRRQVMSAGQMMIHNAWGFTIGDHHDHADMAKLLAQQDQVLAGVYAARSGRPVDDFLTLMDDETWLTDQAAVDAGLADDVLDPPKKDADDGDGGTSNRMPDLAPPPAASVPGDTTGTMPAVDDHEVGRRAALLAMTRHGGM